MPAPTLKPLPFATQLPATAIETLHAGPDGMHLITVLWGVRMSFSANLTEPLPKDRTEDSRTQTIVRLAQRLVSPNILDLEYSRLSTNLIARVVNADTQFLFHYAGAFRQQKASQRFLRDQMIVPMPFFLHVDVGDRACLQYASGPNKYSPGRIPDGFLGAFDIHYFIDPDIPVVPIDAILVDESLGHSNCYEHVTCKVTVNGETMFCKAERGGIAFVDSVVGRDLETMLEIRKMGKEAKKEGRPTPITNVPALRGIIRHPTEGHIIGFLRDWVPGTSLDNYDTNKVTLADRAQWSDEIADTMARLHLRGCAWAGVETEHVIIDDSRKAWMIDFGAHVNTGFKTRESEAQADDWDEFQSLHTFLSPEDGMEL